MPFAAIVPGGNHAIAQGGRGSVRAVVHGEKRTGGRGSVRAVVHGEKRTGGRGSVRAAVPVR